MNENLETAILAYVNGQAVVECPKDLFIPPEALTVFLETFEGPLDLLLYLIRKHNLDILDIPIADITRQYMEYIDLMQHCNIELAAEYLLMAAILAEIKSRMLLPKPKTDEEDGEEVDPRAELVRRLQEYERFKKAAEGLDELPRVGRDLFVTSVAEPEDRPPLPKPNIAMAELMDALREVLRRSELYSSHQIQFEPVTVRERMSQVLEKVNSEQFLNFGACFKPEEGRMGVVVTFMALLELLRLGLIDLMQSAPYAPIHIKAVESVHNG